MRLLLSDPTALSLEGRVVGVISPLESILFSLSSCLQNLRFILNVVMVEVIFWENLAATHREDAGTPQGWIFIWDLKNWRALGQLLYHF